MTPSTPHPSRSGTRPGPRSAPLALLLAALALAGTAGCGGGESRHEITEVRERADAGPQAPEVSVEERLGFRNPHAPARDTKPKPRSWSYATPTGWTELPPAPMRDLGWRVAGSPDAECTFSALQGTGGGLVANVNRWRKQMSLEDADEEAIARLPKDKVLLGMPAVLVELEGVYRGMRGEANVQGAKLLGLVVELPGLSAFLKMTGPAAVVDAEAERFHALAASMALKMTPPTAPGADPHAPAESPRPRPPAPFQWTVPAGWKAMPDKPMRVVTLVPEGATDTECYVTILGGSGGGIRMNVDRWRQQIGLPDMTDEEFAALPRAQVLGAEARFCVLEGTYGGMGGAKKEGYMLLGMALERGRDSVFVKMTGPAATLRGEQERFRSFCESFHE